MRMLAMLLVVAGHSAWLIKVHPEAHRFIYLFHMPVFFFVSGAVFRFKPFRTLVRDRGERLLVPYATVILLATLYYLHTKRPFSVDYPWAGLLWATGHSIPWTPLWFLPTLFLVTVGHATVAAVQERNQLGPWFLIATITILVMVQWAFLVIQGEFPALDNFGRPIGWPWGLDLLPICMAYFALGALSRSPRVESQLRRIRGRIGVTALLASLVVFILIFNAGASLDLNNRRFLPFAGVVAASVCGTLMALFASRILASSTSLSVWAQAFSEKAMVIFLFHSPIQAALLRALPADRVSSAAAAYVAAIALPILVHTFFFKRWAVFNFLVGGGRRHSSPLSPA